MTPTEIHETLDRRGLLEAAHGAGCYALHLDVSDSVESVARDLMAVSGAVPEDAPERLADADRVAYVGASRDVYARLQEHARGKTRTATALEVFDIQDVADIYPTRTPFDDEWSIASELTHEGWTTWVNGEVLG